MITISRLRHSLWQIGVFMSTFSKEQLKEIYESYLPLFTELAKKANENGVHLELQVNRSGDIEFMSRDYFSEGNRDFVRVHTILQGKGYVSDGSRIIVLREKI